MAKFYLVNNTEEWGDLPNIYKAAQWFYREITVPGREDIKFKSIPVMVEIQHKGVTKLVTVRGIIGSIVRKEGCKVTGVLFHNFIRIDAELITDEETGAFAIKAAGTTVIKQGGYKGFVPGCVYKDDEDGEYYPDYGLHTNCYYEDDPFRGRGSRKPAKADQPAQDAKADEIPDWAQPWHIREAAKYEGRPVYVYESHTETFEGRFDNYYEMRKTWGGLDIVGDEKRDDGDWNIYY